MMKPSPYGWENHPFVSMIVSILKLSIPAREGLRMETGSPLKSYATYRTQPHGQRLQCLLQQRPHFIKDST